MTHRFTRLVGTVALGGLLASPAAAQVSWKQGDFLVTTNCYNFGGCPPWEDGVRVLDGSLAELGFLRPGDSHAQSLDLDQNGNLVICNHQDSFVGIYGSSGNLVFSFDSLFFSCTGLAIDRDRLGRIYVTPGLNSSSSDGIVEIDFSGNVVRRFGAPTAYSAVARVPGGKLWAAHFSDGRIDVWDLASLSVVQTIGNAEDVVAWSLFHHAAGGSVLAGRRTGRIDEYALDGSFRRIWPTNVASSNSFVGGFTVGPGGYVYGTIQETTKPLRVVKWTASGQFQGRTDIPETYPDHFGSDAFSDKIVWIATDPPTHLPPALTGPTTFPCVAVGGAIAFDVVATDPEGAPTTIAVAPLPSGATFTTASAGASVTGSFSWTPGPGDVGTHSIVFTATDSGSPPLVGIHAVLVTVAAAAPLGSGPEPQTICPGASATLSVTTDGSPVQWQASTDSYTFFDVAGATGATWNTGPLWSTIYVRVRASAACGELTSPIARIYVVAAAPPVGDSLLVSKDADGTVRASWDASPLAEWYEVRLDGAPSFAEEAVSVVSEPSWSVEGSGALFAFDVEAANGCGP